MNETVRKWSPDFNVSPQTEQFFSDDPFKVLGILPDSTPDIVEKTKKRLFGKYHPDRFADDPKFRPTAEEIFKLIQQAVDKIERLRGSGSSYQSPAGESRRPSVEPKTESERQEGFEKQIIFWIYYLDTTDSIRNLKNIIASKRVSKDQLVAILNSPEVLHKLMNRFLMILSLSRKDNNDFEIIKEFVKNFGELGAPVDKILNNVVVGYAINNPLFLILKKSSDSQEYIRYIKEWEKLDIDTNIIRPGFFEDRRDKDVKDFFKKAVEEIMSGSNLFGGKNRKKKKLQSFVDEWSQLGWVPSKEVVDLLES